MGVHPVACLIETIVDGQSLAQFKKTYAPLTLRSYFLQLHGDADGQAFREVQCNFIDSLVGYSLLCYILQIKDRHNGNILVRDTGHLVHIDFGFMLANSPGSLNWECEYFKLTSEYVEVIGGLQSPMWQYFKASMLMGFMQLRQRHHEILGLVKWMRQACVATGTLLPGLVGGPAVVDRLEDRFQLTLSASEVAEFVEEMIDTSLDNWRTLQYDQFQYLTQGIFA
eukprot:TRINITY_DN9802_c0_g1_i1.p1 TRINITY_DN9802_c0_g1~~TRINITY_DN9802_c0_g1_i1.p1  ORF type:complete len:233 (-),score=22.81 TRINITY_DN9802_c0_g1_i1:127-801(-)